MSADDYLESILRKYAVDLSPAANAANLLTPLLRDWAGSSLLDIQFSGSYAKGTAISLGTDIDLFISLDSNQSVKDLYWSLFHHCEKALQRPQVQNVSLRVQSQGIDIDLVPGRKRPGATTDHTLYKRKKNSWVQTNVAQHIRVVCTSERTAEIRVLKIWRELHHLDFPSFYLELTVIAALCGNQSANLAERVFSILGYLAQKFLNARVLDPANTNNVISDDLCDRGKARDCRRRREVRGDALLGADCMVTGTHRQPTSIKLKELFLSLQNQLQAKMVTSREFVHHPSAKGAASEQAWLGMFNAYLPQRYRADSAFVIDCEGELSDQIDIVIYDRHIRRCSFTRTECFMCRRKACMRFSTSNSNWDAG